MDQASQRGAGPSTRAPGGLAAWLLGVPVVLWLALLGTYLVSRDFYLEHVLAIGEREGQAVEILTFLLALAGSVLCLVGGRRFLRGARARPAFDRFVGSGAVLPLVMGAASLFFAGEEISWGQSYLNWETPESYESFSRETNLHNSGLPVRQLANVFIIVFFFAIPIGWHLGRNKPRPRWCAGWAAAVPGLVPIATVAFAMAVRSIKKVVRAAGLHEAERWRPFYEGFLEQINEHSEMLTALGIFFYALQVVAMTRRKGHATEV